MILWAGVVLSAVILLAVIGVYALLHSARFHAYLLRTAQEKATIALGSDVRLRDYAFHWAGLAPSIELYDVVVHGAPPYTDPPLLQADMLRVQVTISSLWHRSWYVNDVLIEHPVLHVLADKQGRTNLPQPAKASSNSQSSVDVFDLGVRHLALNRGEIYYQDRKSRLAADLRDLGVQIGFAALEKKYSGTLSYHDGRVQWQGANPVPHSLNAHFSATPTQFNIESAELHTQASHVSLRATVQNYAQPDLRVTYEAVVDGGELRRVFKSDSLPQGIVSLSGSMEYENQRGRTFLATTIVRGEFHSGELASRQSGVLVKVRNVAGQYSLQNGDAKVTAVRAELLGGSLAAELTIRDVGGAEASNLNASLKNVSLAAAQALVPELNIQNVAFAGSMNANVEANWVRALDNLALHGDATIAANMRAAQGDGVTPVNGVIHASYNAPRQTLQLRQSHINTAQTSLSLDGTISGNSSLQVRVESNELHEIEAIAAAFQPNSAPLGLYGQAKLTADITGATDKPQVRGQLEASNVRLKGTSWKLLRTQLAISPTAVALDHGEADPANQGHITFQLGASLQQWMFADTSAFQARLQATSLDAAALAKTAGLSAQVSGVLSADLDMHGTQMAPIGQGKIELSHAVIAGEPVKTANVSFHADGNSVHAQGQIGLTAGSATADVKYEPKQQIYEASVRTAGIKLEELETLKTKNLGLAGVLTLNAEGRGTLRNPGLQATVEIPQLTVQNQSIKDLKLTADVANQVAKFDLASDVLGIHVAGHGSIQLAGDYAADVSVDTQVIPLQPFIAMAAPEQAQNLTGQTEIHAMLHGPLKNESQLEAHLVVPQLQVSYKNSIQLAATAPIRADYANGVLDVKKSVIHGTGTDLTFQANLPTAKESAISVLLQGTVDLQLAALFDPDLKAGGQLRFDINSYGQRSDPNIQGQIKIVNASASEAGTPVSLQNGNGTLTLTRDRLSVSEFKGQLGGGTVTMGGAVVYRPSLRLDLAMQTEDVRLLYQQSIRATLKSNLALAGGYEDATLRGQVSVEQLSFTSGFDLVNFASQFGSDVTVPSTGGFAQNLHLQVNVQTPSGLNLTSRQLSLAGTADLQVRGTATEPVMLGRINVSDGDLIFYGNRYVVQGGTIDFRNPSRTEPVLNISANTTIQQYDIQMHLWGPIDRLNTNYSSDPSLPPSDIINLIAFGKTAEASAANPTAPGMLGAQSVVASQVSGQLTNRISEVAGISQLSVDPQLGSSQQSPGAQITIQQRVTGKIFVTFSTDVTGTQQDVIQVEYRLNPRASVKALRDQNGGFSFETNFKKEW